MIVMPYTASRLSIDKTCFRNKQYLLRCSVDSKGFQNKHMQMLHRLFIEPTFAVEKHWKERFAQGSTNPPQAGYDYGDRDVQDLNRRTGNARLLKESLQFGVDWGLMQRNGTKFRLAPSWRQALDSYCRENKLAAPKAQTSKERRARWITSGKPVSFGSGRPEPEKPAKPRRPLQIPERH